MNFHFLKGIYILNFGKFHQTVPKIICDGRTHWRTDKRTHKGDSIDSIGLQPGTKKSEKLCIHFRFYGISRYQSMEKGFSGMPNKKMGRKWTEKCVILQKIDLSVSWNRSNYIAKFPSLGDKHFKTFFYSFFLCFWMTTDVRLNGYNFLLGPFNN